MLLDPLTLTTDKIVWSDSRDGTGMLRPFYYLPNLVEKKVAKWEQSYNHLWAKDENGDIDMFAFEEDYHNGPRCTKCDDYFCAHCTPNWAETKCSIPHYVCSCCHAEVRTASAYCPRCGSKMVVGNG